jgi:P27 family predicted phage terminase small subunit
MGRRGPGREPLELKLIKGTARGKDKRRRSPHPEGTGARLPKKLMTPEALKIASILRPVLVNCRLLTDADVVTFALACSHGGLALKAMKDLTEGGLTKPDERGLDRKNPLHQIARDHSESFKAYARMFGMSPSARSEIDFPGMPRDRRELLLASDEEARRMLDDGWFSMARKK